MLNREIIRYKLERLESSLTKQQFILKRQGSLEEYIQIHNDMRELISEIKGYIEHEPRSAKEINTSI
jgi:heme-degrading monooxygenase HmoA